MTQSKIFEPDGRAIAYTDEGDGPTLVLTVGGALGTDSLAVVSHILVDQGFRIVRISSRAGSERTLESAGEQARDALDVIDHVGLGDTWVGGHGFGGTVARLVAADHGHRIDGLLLLGVEDAQIELPPEIPVLILQGSNDDVTPPENAERLRLTAPERASITTFDGEGHDFPVTRPVETSEDIEEYLDWD